jgi:hypothetical protein
MLIQELTVDDSAWTSLLQTVPHDFYHLPCYTHLEAQRIGGEPIGYVIRTMTVVRSAGCSYLRSCVPFPPRMYSI